MPDSSRITGRKTVWEHASRKFRIDEITVEQDGSDSLQWVSFERGDSVAALIVNTDTNHVILVRQLRPSVVEIEGSMDGIVETVAGMIRQNEVPLRCLQREIEEETGYQLTFDPVTGRLGGTEHICDYYTSPGGSSERIHLYYVAIDGKTQKAAGGGVRDEGENIELVVLPVDEFFEQVGRGAFHDAKIMIAGQWLQKRWGNRRSSTHVRQEFTLRTDAEYRPGKQPRIVGYYTTDIGHVKDIDVWVNSSNAEFLMDTIYHKTLSARIRTLGGKLAGDVMVEDTIQELLTRRMGIGKGLDIGNVLETDPGHLRQDHKVRCLLHVASVKARIQPNGFASPVTSIADLERCVVRVLARCDELNARRFSLSRRMLGPYRSILLPLFGAGVDRDPNLLKTKKICEALIPAAVKYLQDNPRSEIERVYFLAYKEDEIEICDSVFARISDLERIRSEERGSETDAAPAAPSTTPADLPPPASPTAGTTTGSN
ncbi:MAG: NUDIX hydrolase [Alphaproteobacteria bacterium]|nr:NUDIX hydrolase [Alphaproteobacteria bacterium]